MVAVKIVDRRVMQQLGQRLGRAAAAGGAAGTVLADAEAAKGGDELLRREIAVLKKLQHPNIVQLLDVIDDGSKYLYIVLEHMPACLEDLQVSEADAVPIVAGLLDALSFCHAHHVVHRDIKNANALLGADGVTAKLCDFGFATEWRAQEGENIVLSTAMGTLLFMSPEMLHTATPQGAKGGGKHARRRLSLPFEGTSADCWAMGVLAYVLVTGDPPFGSKHHGRKENVAEIMAANYSLSGLSTEFAEFCEMAMHISPSERGSADDLLRSRWLVSEARTPTKKKKAGVAVTAEELRDSIRTLQMEDVGMMALRARRLAVEARQLAAIRIQAAARGRLTRQSPCPYIALMISNPRVPPPVASKAIVEPLPFCQSTKNESKLSQSPATIRSRFG